MAVPEDASTATGAGRRTQRRSEQLAGMAFVAPAVIVIVGLGIFPAAWATLLALQKWNGFSEPRFVGADNFERMSRDTDLVAAAWHTLLYTGLFMPVSVVGGLLLAAALNRRIRFMGLYRTAIFVPYVASAAVTGLLANFVFNPEVGVVNNVFRVLGLPQQGWLEDPSQAMVVLVIMSLWGQLGFVTVIYLAALQDVDTACLEAAEVDGASASQRFRHITVPQVAPATAFVVIWQTIQCIQLFDLVYTTTRGGPIGATTTLVYYLWEQAFRQLSFGYGSAIAWVLFVVTMVMTLVLVAIQRRRGGEQPA
ncbi:sugar ABC transporter permease [Nocardioides cavernae]|uniref:carbohydrate ABC transporter permease n=1 Tax=Nocardioides TaxID=1839 RepID=UPI001910019E|nr:MULTISPECIES: sugar ABC transporter permease [Nocardioides]MCK9824339.1 sugar ABC transporter permease [Nocardioides cavernae]